MLDNPASTGPILQVEHLSMRFGGLRAIDDLSFEARRGEITALIGPNGAGKTTVFNCITGFYKPTEGMITLRRRGGEQYLLERMPDFHITRDAKVARTFQNIRLFAGMTVLENLLVAQHNMLMKASGFTILGLFGFSGYRKASAESIEVAKFWLDKADLTDRADDPAGDLPYGAQRRLEIVRAMCTQPELLCLDEPAAGLNPHESAALNRLLNEVRETSGTSILLIEHDMSVVMEISDHIVVLEYGQKISDGDPTSVKSDPKVIAAYLGVDDEEIEDILTEVGEETVVEGFDAEPDASHNVEPSASFFAGPISDTIAHSDEEEHIAVSPGASRARIVEAREKAEAAAAVAREKAKPAGQDKRGKPAAAANRTAARKAADTAVKSRTSASAAERRKPGAARSGSLPGALSKPRGGKADNLTRIKGIGIVNEKKLHEHGIFHFDQIAAWKAADVKTAETYLAFDGRIKREEWVKQARLLAKGKESEFSRRVDAGKVVTSRAPASKGRRK
jgi:branched-chain amino acid transport system ATP-binding protein